MLLNLVLDYKGVRVSKQSAHQLARPLLPQSESVRQVTGFYASERQAASISHLDVGVLGDTPEATSRRLQVPILQQSAPNL